MVQVLRFFIDYHICAAVRRLRLRTAPLHSFCSGLLLR